MRRLWILEPHLRTLTEHAAATYPEECCGVLMGRSRGGNEEEVVVERVLPLRNERPDSRHNRYLIPPEAVLAAHKEARAAGLDVVGYYHSHPDHAAVPSEFDREHAWPGISYLIVEVRKGRVAEVRSWRLADDREGFKEEAVAEISQAVEAAKGKEAVR